MSIKIQRFDFGNLRDFRGPITVKTVEEEIRIEEPEAPPPPPTFTLTELNAAKVAAKKEGFDEGFETGLMKAKAETDADIEVTDAIIQRFGETLSTLDERYQELLTKESADLSALVLMIAKKVAGEALEERSIETITAMVSRCLPVLFSKPRVIIDIHPDMLEQVLARIETYLRAQGFEGDIQFRSNANLGTHDVSLDWGSGQAVRSTELLWQEIETLITRIPLEITFAETLQSTTHVTPIDLETGE